MRTSIITILALLYLSSGLSAQCSTFINELNVTLDRERDVFVIKGLSCDQCRFGASGRNVCLCRMECKLTSEEKTIIEDCYQECMDRYSEDEEGYDYCLEDCSNLEWELLDACRDSCGPRPLPVRAIHSISFLGRVWFGTGLEETFQGEPDLSVLVDLGDQNPPNSFTIEVEDVPSHGVSYCYMTYILIRYTDGSCCWYINWECFNLG